jgi:four helix bundle protein
MRSRPYEKLIAWQEAHRLCIHAYELTKRFPSEERFSMTNQVRRSAYSIPMNIAEGNAKRSTKDKAHFFEMAIASLEELHYQCKLSYELKYISDKQLLDIDDQIQRTGFLLTKLRSSILS